MGALKCAKFQQNTARNFRSGNFSDFFHLQKFFFFAELQELEHSAEGTFFRKIRNFSTFSSNSKIPKIYLSGPISVQSFSKKYSLKKSDIQTVGFCGKFSNFQLSSKFVKNNTFGPLSVRSFSKIQRETFEVEIFPFFSPSKKKKNFFAEL